MNILSTIRSAIPKILSSLNSSKEATPKCEDDSPMDSHGRYRSYPLKTPNDYKEVKALIKRVEKAIEAAETGKTKLTEAELTLEGMSSRKNRILLNELITTDDNYLEIGVFKGSTFVSALYGNNPKYAVAIDNFSQFDPQNINLNVFKQVVSERGFQNFTLLNANCFNIPVDLANQYLLNREFTVYFYDGDHKERDQYLALYYYYLTLADKFIFIVDDYNTVEAQVGTLQAMDELKIIVHKEWKLLTDRNGDTGSWWNGLYIAVCEKAK